MDRCLPSLLFRVLAAHPHRTQELLKYAKDIRLGAKKYEGHGWIEYDQQFRLRLDGDPTTISFANIDCELWILCMSSPTKPSNEGQPKCINFNNGHCTRTPCYFLHKCLNCSLDHSSRSWRRQAPMQQTWPLITSVVLPTAHGSLHPSNLRDRLTPSARGTSN